MKLYTLDNVTRDSKQDYLYDLFNTKISQKSYTKFFWYAVSMEEAMRIDMISKNVYGTIDFVDEILSVNGIVDPFSIKYGDKLLMIYPEDMTTMYLQDIEMTEDLKYVNKNKETTKDPKREKQRQLPPNIKEDPNIGDININSGKVRIVNELK